MATILIIEDEKDLAMLLKERFETAGFEAKVALGYLDGLEQISQDKPDMITLDLVLPDGAGADILANIRKNTNTYKIPVVVVSSTELETKNKEVSIQGYLPKPVRFEKLLSMVKICLAQAASGNKS